MDAPGSGLALSAPQPPTPAASAAARLAPASGAGVALGAFVTTPRAHQPPSWQLLEFWPDCELHPLSFQGLVGTEASSLRGTVGSFSEKPGAGGGSEVTRSLGMQVLLVFGVPPSGARVTAACVETGRACLSWQGSGGLPQRQGSKPAPPAIPAPEGGSCGAWKLAAVTGT